jgi:hypothetical protein
VEQENSEQPYETYLVPDTSLSSTLVTLTSSEGPLATGVTSLQFVFSGYQNGGTAFREFQVNGTLDASPVPEPATLLSTACLIVSGLMLRRRIVPTA